MRRHLSLILLVLLSTLPFLCVGVHSDSLDGIDNGNVHVEDDDESDSSSEEDDIVEFDAANFVKKAGTFVIKTMKKLTGTAKAIKKFLKDDNVVDKIEDAMNVGAELGEEMMNAGGKLLKATVHMGDNGAVLLEDLVKGFNDSHDVIIEAVDTLSKAAIEAPSVDKIINKETAHQVSDVIKTIGNKFDVHAKCDHVKNADDLEKCKNAMHKFEQVKEQEPKDSDN